MRALLILVGFSTFAAELPPKGITVSQWVREDIFSGFLGNDMPRFEKGLAKIHELLAANPQNDEARAWLAGAQLYQAGNAFKRDEKDGAGARLLLAAMGSSNQALMRSDPSALRILAGAFVFLSDRLPEPEREIIVKKGRELFAAVRQQEDRRLEKLPLHLKAEVLAGQAQAAMRLGLQDEAAKYLNEIVAKLPNTHYSEIAEKWLADPASATKSQLVCHSCHDENRLENRLKAIATK